MKKIIAILTNFQDLNPGYSLSGVVIDQCRMLLEHGHKVYLYVSENFSSKHNEDAGLDNATEHFANDFVLVPKMKLMKLLDYPSAQFLSMDHRDQAREAADTLLNDFAEKEVEMVFTHDFIYTGWNLPYALVVKWMSEDLRARGMILPWFHWIHSVPEPSARRDWWDIKEYGEDCHTIIFPNQTEINRVANSFLARRKNVRAIPHIKDIRAWYNFSEESWHLTRVYPKIMRADIVQVYPCSTDRLLAKQLHLVIALFANFKKAGKSVFLLIANQWATGRQRAEDINFYKEMGEACGLEYEVDFLFTSTFEVPYSSPNDMPYSKGIPKRMLSELQLLSNLFIFPTREESFGLVGPEAAFSGALVVANRSLQMMGEVLGVDALSFDFGSHHNDAPFASNEEYLWKIANLILDCLHSSSAIATKTYCRQRYNYESIYNRYYAPLLCQETGYIPRCGTCGGDIASGGNCDPDLHQPEVYQAE